MGTNGAPIESFSGLQNLNPNHSGNMSSTGERNIKNAFGGAQGTASMEKEVEIDEVVTFYDATSDLQQAGTVTSMEYPFPNSIEMSMKEYLTRPVKIYSFSWGDTGTFNFQINPFALFLQDVAVSRKLANFYLLRTGGLRLRIMATGNPYSYGRYFIGWWPLYANDALAVQTVSLPHDTKVSTLPCFTTIDPSANTVSELIIPEFNRFTGVITSTFDLGRLVGTIGASLQTTSTLLPSVNIHIYANFIDPSVAFNTATPPAYATSGEWKGKLSKPLEHFSKAIEPLGKLPFIGGFATATGAAAQVGSTVARNLGFSKPIDNVRNIIVNKMWSNMTNVDGMDSSTSLSLTGTAQTSIDPGIVGLPPEDEHNLLNLLQRPSLCEKCTWASSNAEGDTICTMINSPFLCNDYNLPLALGSYTPLTNLAYLSAPFLAWRGTIKYRFVFCVSKYHTGRVQIIYDPNSLVTTLDPTNVTKNWIVDLSEQTSIDIEIPFASILPFVQNNMDPGTTLMLGQSALTTATGAGFLYTKVIAPLKCGSTLTTNVNILIFNSAGADFELNQPSSLLLRSKKSVISWFPQVVPTAPPASITYSNWATSSKPMSNIFYSEQVDSVRSLLKRYNFVKRISTPVVTNSTQYIGIRANPDQPGTIAYVTTNNQTLPMTYFSYYAAAYAAYRGSFRIKILDSLSELSRCVVFGPKVSNNMNSAVTRGSVEESSILNTTYDGLYSVAGNEVIECTIPWRRNVRCDPCTFFPGIQAVAQGILLLLSNPTDSTITYNGDLYTSCGDDFSFYYYKGAPFAYVVNFP